MRQLIENIRAIMGQNVDDLSEAVATSDRQKRQSYPVTKILALSDIYRVEAMVRAALPRIQASGLCHSPPAPGRYLCYKDPDYGFVIMLMAWGRGEGTPIHDHGCWGVEAVLTGELVVTEYSECEVNPQPRRQRICRAGDVMHNLPPARDVHTVENLGDRLALSLHIYGREMSGNRQFVDGEGFKPCCLKTCNLSLDEFEPLGIGLRQRATSF